jgi:hypothetical protein
MKSTAIDCAGAFLGGGQAQNELVSLPLDGDLGTFFNATVWDAGIERMNRFIICMMNRRLSRQ